MSTSIRKRMAVAFPGKEILIGETGWPSQGRMREGALPSRTSQARVVSEILDIAKREGFRVNLIEAYDQPWKRQLEGTVGGYWGLFDAYQREVKYPPGIAISNFPSWKLQMACGMVLSAFTFLAAMLTLRRRPWTPRLELLDCGGDLGDDGRQPARHCRRQDVLRKLRHRRLAAMGRAAVSRDRFANAVRQCADGGAIAADVPRTARSARAQDQIGDDDPARPRAGDHRGHRGETALGFTFDPRYRDFPYASLTMAVVPFAGLMLLNRPQAGARPIAEAVFAGVIGGCAVYVGINEGTDNWQSMWTCAMYVVFALTLWRARAAQSPE